MPSQRAIVVADDLSGATDTGHQFAARGYPTTVATGVEATPAADSVLVLNTDSRYSDPAEAADRVQRAVGRVDAAVPYKKVDSTLRGNLVAEIDAMVGATAADLAVVAPAFPSTGRTTVAGTHLVEGTPVTRTAAGEDPETPVEHSQIPRLLAGSRFEVARMGIDTVAAGRERVREHLGPIAEREGRPLVVCDAATDGHLAAIAAGAADLDAAVTYVGSGGLARFVRLDGGRDGVLGVVGSANPATFEQLAALPSAVSVTVDGERAVVDPDAAVEAVASRACETLAARSRAVITAAVAPEDVEATVAAGAAAGLSDRETRERIASVLGRCARAVHRRRRLGGLFATGGAVATAVLDALDADGVRLTGHAVEDAIPLGRIRGGAAPDLALVTKAGAFGGASTIVKTLDYLRQYDDGE